MAWQALTDVPFVPTTNLYFSPIIGNLVYAIDRGTNFWRYNFSTRVWTQLADPPFATGVYRQLTYRNNRLYCCDDSGGVDMNQRISIYNIATNTWTFSSAVPLIAGVLWYLRSLCFSDDDTIWVWTTRNFTHNQMRVQRYVISTDTWTSFAATTGVIATAQGRAAAFLGGIVYGACIGASAERICRYTIATDAYAYTAAFANANFCWASDPDRLWYTTAAGLPGTYTYSFVTVATEIATLNYWPANAARLAGWFGLMNVNGLVSVVDQAGNVNPMVYQDGFLVPFARTDPATGVT